MVFGFCLAACSYSDDSGKITGVLIFSGSSYARTNNISRKLLLKMPTCSEEQIRPLVRDQVLGIILIS